jgi:hypothetical protein
MTTSSKLSVTLPHDPLTALSAHEEPTPFAVRLLRREIFDNALAVESELGGGDHGHLGMVMPNVDYITVSTGGAAYAFPVKPAVPNYAGESAAARDALKDEYKIARILESLNVRAYDVPDYCRDVTHVESLLGFNESSEDSGSIDTSTYTLTIQSKLVFISPFET